MYVTRAAAQTFTDLFVLKHNKKVHEKSSIYEEFSVIYFNFFARIE